MRLPIMLVVLSVLGLALTGAGRAGAPPAEAATVQGAQVVAQAPAQYVVPIPPTADAKGKILFFSNRDGNNEVYVMNPDGTDEVNLTNNNADDSASCWSPDMEKIAFRSNRDGNREIYVMNADGTNVVRLTYTMAEDTAPAWSPDGSSIAFASRRDGNWEIYVMNPDGTHQMNISYSPYMDDHAPVWSPDGKKIAFYTAPTTADEFYQVRNAEIYVMNADGTNRTNLTNNPADDVDPAWSPDGSKIAFSSNRHTYFEICVMNAADGTNETNITSLPIGIPESVVDGHASWSADGTRIAFSSTRDGFPPDLFVMYADGHYPVRITNNKALDWWPSWSPLPR